MMERVGRGRRASWRDLAMSSKGPGGYTAVSEANDGGDRRQRNECIAKEEDTEK